MNGGYAAETPLLGGPQVMVAAPAGPGMLVVDTRLGTIKQREEIAEAGVRPHAGNYAAIVGVVPRETVNPESLPIVAAC